MLGREFAYELIEPVAQRAEAELQAALGSARAMPGCCSAAASPPHASYLFKHALVQDAAYGTLLRGRRQELHARVAAVLEQHFADLVERQPELLAHHLTGAGQTERAVDQWLKAGQHAAARSAHPEAIGHFERGLALLASLPERPDRDRQEIELQLARGVSLSTLKGFSSAEAAEAYTRARDLSEKEGKSIVCSFHCGVYGTLPGHPTSMRPEAATTNRGFNSRSKSILAFVISRFPWCDGEQGSGLNRQPGI